MDPCWKPWWLVPIDRQTVVPDGVWCGASKYKFRSDDLGRLLLPLVSAWKLRKSWQIINPFSLSFFFFYWRPLNTQFEPIRFHVRFLNSLSTQSHYLVLSWEGFCPLGASLYSFSSSWIVFGKLSTKSSYSRSHCMYY